MNILSKYKIIKFIPGIGIIFCLIDSSHDGYYWERLYKYYHMIVSSILVQLLTKI